MADVTRGESRLYGVLKLIKKLQYFTLGTTAMRNFFALDNWPLHNTKEGKRYYLFT